MENKRYELDKVLIDININSDNKDNSMSTYIYNYTKILEAFITDINKIKNSNGSKLEEFDIIDKFKRLVISEADRCAILNRATSPISDNKNNKENKVSNNTMDLNELIKEITENDKNKRIYGEIDNNIDSNKSSDKTADNTNKVDIVNKIINNEMDKICEEINNIWKNDNNETKQKVNESIKPKTIKPKEEYNTINNKVDLSSGYEIYKNSGLSNKIEKNTTIIRDYMANPVINKEEDPLDDFEFVAEAFSRLISKFNKGDI